ncbi:MAG TPA: hypothetical protein VN633_23800 [Bryobacteraceae bacterium]|nr:hypothetical protein [Bryobacteraceae bacterium]
MNNQGLCPLTTSQIIDEYFIENRTRILDLAAYLDRLMRSADGQPASGDFRMQAFRQALQILSSDEPNKIDHIQLVFSDPTVELKPQLDTKSASGAWNPAQEVQ